MKQLFKTRKKLIKIEDVPRPECDQGEVLIEVHSSLISSGTETMGMASGEKSTGGRIKSLVSDMQRGKDILLDQGITEAVRKIRNLENISAVSGYSVAGVVVEVGGRVDDFGVGDRVAAGGSGYASHAEVVAVPKNLVIRIPDKLDFKCASFTTVGSIALQGVRQAQVQLGDTVIVIGLGIIGLLSVQLLKAAGCKVIGIDLYHKKVDAALGFGLDLGLVQGEDDIVAAVASFTRNTGADAVLLCAATQSSDPVNLAMKIARKKGRVVVVGAVGLSINRSPFYEKEIEFTIACSYGPGRYDLLYEEKGIDYPVAYVRWTENRNMEFFAGLMAEGKVDVRSMITHEFPIENAASAFDTLLKDPQNTLGVVINYPERDLDEKMRKRVYISGTKARSEYSNVPLGIAVIGAGGFASRTHLPNICKIKNVELKAVVTKTGKNARRIGNEFKADYCSTDYKEVLADKCVNAVVIATRHDLHYEIANDAVLAGKHVLLEKPMGLTSEQVENLAATVEKSGVVFAVGYNRRYSPLAVRARELISKDQGPCIVNYRVNAGYIPADHWTQDPEIGGGRIIGEACHFFDLIGYFIDSELESVTAEYIPVDRSTVVSKDNVVTVLKYRNGSVGTLTYTSLGSKEFGKEYIEIFKHGKTIVLDDFKDLRLYGYKQRSLTLKKQDKGHYEEMVQFIHKILGKESSIISLEESVQAAKISISVSEMLK